MRQWLVNPSILCRKHLLGEHVEHHMFLGTLIKRCNITGYINNNLLEILSLQARHNELAEEINKRGYKHNSPLIIDNNIYNNYTQYLTHKINKEESLKELIKRCELCRKNHLNSL
jgi:hypothetical protein